MKPYRKMSEKVMSKVRWVARWRFWMLEMIFLWKILENGCSFVYMVYFEDFVQGRVVLNLFSKSGRDLVVIGYFHSCTASCFEAFS